MTTDVQPSMWTVQEVGVDYITATTREARKLPAGRTLAQTLLVAEQRQGEDVRPFEWMGYRGLACGAVTWGERDDGFLLRLSSHCAATHWRTVALTSDNVSRLDLAVTARPVAPDPQTGPRAWQQAIAWTEEHNPAGVVTQVTDNRGGYTVYLGSRTSERFARLYDKGAESRTGEYEGAWRWELELKKELAWRTFGQLVAAQSAEPLIRATVHAHFRARGLAVPWTANGASVGASIARRPSDSAVRRRWLREQVRPSVVRVIEEAGIEALLGDLGLLRSERLLDWARGTATLALRVEGGYTVDVGRRDAEPAPEEGV